MRCFSDCSGLRSWTRQIESLTAKRPFSCFGWFRHAADHSKRWSWLEKQTVKTTSYWHLPHWVSWVSWHCWRRRILMRCFADCS